jgi:hypothetical protein
MIPPEAPITIPIKKGTPTGINDHHFHPFVQAQMVKAISTKNNIMFCLLNKEQSFYSGKPLPEISLKISLKISSKSLGK